jgi:hypothetical protein
MNIAQVAKYVALPTWLLIWIMVRQIPDHPYGREYPSMLAWALHGPDVFRIFDLALWMLALAFVTRTVALFL